MKRLVAGLVAAAALVLLTGCGETWEDLAENKKRCQELGGTYDQWENGWGQDRSSCDFSDAEVSS